MTNPTAIEPTEPGEYWATEKQTAIRGTVQIAAYEHDDNLHAYEAGTDAVFEIQEYTDYVKCPTEAEVAAMRGELGSANQLLREADGTLLALTNLATSKNFVLVVNDLTRRIREWRVKAKAAQPKAGAL